MMDQESLFAAGKLPRELLPWKSKQGHLNAMLYNDDAFLFDTHSMASMHLVNEEGFGGFTIMDDSDRELSRHLQAVWLAEGNVLKTGLGFGCFVRMALLNPRVKHIDVIEKDPDIAEHFGCQFDNNDRVTIHVCDAFKFDFENYQWDLAWHDIYCDGNDGLARLHFQLMIKYRKVAKIQSAWAIDRWARKLLTKAGVRTF
jgi:hypothetical protein